MGTTRTFIGGSTAILIGSIAAVGAASPATADDAVPAKSRLVATGWASTVDVSDNGSTVVYDTIPSGSDTVVRRLWDRTTGKAVRVTSFDSESGVGDLQLSGDGQDVYWLQGSWGAAARSSGTGAGRPAQSPTSRCRRKTARRR